MNATAVISIADTIAKAAGYIATYLTQGWAKNIPIAAVALATVIAMGLVELVMALGFKGLGKGLKKAGTAVKQGVETAAEGTSKAIKAAVKGTKSLLKSGAKLASRTGSMLIRNGKLVIKGLQKGFANGIKKLSNLIGKLLEKYRFKSFEFEREGDFVVLYGIINPRLKLAKWKYKGKQLKIKNADDTAKALTKQELEAVETVSDSVYDVKRSTVGVSGSTETTAATKLIFKSKSEYYDYINNIGKRTDLSIQDRLEKIKEAYKNLGDKTDISCPVDSKYVKGFDDAGRIIYDWPDKMGFDPDTIASITRKKPLPANWDRYGTMGGTNFASIPDNGVKYTYDQRSIPYVENPQAYHYGTFNNDAYFDIIDALKDGNLNAMNAIRKEKGLAGMGIDDFEYYRTQYSNYLQEVKKKIGDVDATYGLIGKAAPWKHNGEVVMQGGAVQIVTPFNGNVLKELGILNKIQ